MAVFLAMIPFIFAGAEVNLDRVYPTVDINVTQNAFFNVTVDVGCSNADCGEINISLDPREGSFNYTFKENDGLFNDTGCVTSTSGLDSQDDRTATFTLGFDFPYYEETIAADDNVRMDTNGKISFGLTTSDFTPSANEMESNKFIAALWDDLRLIGSKHYVCTNQGTSPNRYAVFHWETAHISSSEKVESEIVLHENGNIEINWGDIETKTGTMIVGISNGSDYDYQLLSSVNSDNSSKGWLYSSLTTTKSGLVPNDVTSVPFYTNKTSNPFNISLNQDESEEVTFYVNATGTINETYEFFVYVNTTSNETISNMTSVWNVTIKDPPFIEFINPTLENGSSSLQDFIIANISANSFDIKNITLDLFNSTGLIESASDSASSFSNNFSSLVDGDYYLNATIEDVYGFKNSTETRTITVDTSKIGLSLIFPTRNINATQNEFFEVTVNVSCSVNDCGIVNVTLDPSSQPFSCKEILDLGQSTGNGTYEIYPYGNATATSAYCDMDTNGGGWTLVFGGKGNTNTYKSTWAGWDLIGDTVNLSSKLIEGKSPAYDYVNASAIMLETNYSGGSLIMADFNNTYDALLYLVGPDDPGTNNGNSSWDGGLRGNFSAFGRSGTYFSDDVIKIWQGDGTTDSGDFVTFSTREATDADWNGDTNNIGGEFQTAGPNSADWYHVYVRENISYSTGKSGIIPTDGTATPYFTNVTNPHNITLNKDESVEITFWVNATGDLDVVSEFFVYANKTSNLDVGNMTNLWNVTIVNFTVDYKDPVVTLDSPSDNSGNNENVSFNYNVAETNNVTSCDLILNDEINQTDTSITKNAVQNFTLDNLNVARYEWSVNCTDDYDNIGASKTNSFSIFRFSDFSGNTTDLSGIDISNITNYIIENPENGLINFSEELNLSGGVNVNQYVNISSNRIEVDSNSLSILNISAELSFYNIDFTDPRPLVDDVLCPESICREVSYAGGTYIFNVTGFSVYTVEETPVVSETSTTTSLTVKPSGSSYRSNLRDDSICRKDRDCKNGYSCYNNACVRLFDVEILDITPYPVDSTGFNLLYRIKSIGDLKGDVIVKYWIEKSDKKIGLGQDAIYLGPFEEKIQNIKLFLPLNLSGDYNLFTQANFENYKVESFRNLNIMKKSTVIVVPPEKEVPNLAPISDRGYVYIYTFLILIILFSVIYFVYNKRMVIKKSLHEVGFFKTKREIEQKESRKKHNQKEKKRLFEKLLVTIKEIFYKKKQDLELEENILLCENYKNKLIFFSDELRNSYERGEIDYKEYCSYFEELNLEAQLKYYDDYIGHLKKIYAK